MHAPGSDAGEESDSLPSVASFSSSMLRSADAPFSCNSAAAASDGAAGSDDVKQTP